MIVHPIGMMRANAAGGLNFVDDFTSYTIYGDSRDELKNLAPYDHGSGTAEAFVADSGGVRVARHPGNTCFLNFVGGSVADDREVSVTLHTKGETSQIYFYLSRYDANNYLRVSLDSTNKIGVRQVVAGANQINTNGTGTYVEGDKITASLTGTALVVKKNDVTINSYTAAAFTRGVVRLEFADVASPSSFWEISKFEVRDL